MRLMGRSTSDFSYSLNLNKLVCKDCNLKGSVFDLYSPYFKKINSVQTWEKKGLEARTNRLGCFQFLVLCCLHCDLFKNLISSHFSTFRHIHCPLGLITHTSPWGQWKHSVDKLLFGVAVSLLNI